MNIVIPMAGLGSRFLSAGYSHPKPLITVEQVTLIERSVKSFDVDGRFIFVTRDFDDSSLNRELTSLLRELRPESLEVKVDGVTRGAAETVLASREFITNDEELVIYNCDQQIDWSPLDFLEFVRSHSCDGALLLHESRDPKNSFAEISSGIVCRTVEKAVVSNHALVGFHYWKRGKDFVRSAEALIEAFTLDGRPECYISETFNYLIGDGLKILPYHLAPHAYKPLGTPEDLAIFTGKQAEFSDSARPTLFIDLDGTILEHQHSISRVYERPAKLLSGVREKLNEWDSKGFCIVLVSARKESTRAHTEQQLRGLGIAWDHLVLGVSSGARYLVNDKLDPMSSDRAIAVNVSTNEGFEPISWEALGL